MRLLRTFFCYYIDNPTSSIRSVGRSTRSFNHFNLFDITYTHNLINIHRRLRTRSRIGSYCTSGIIIHTSSINKYNYTGISINGNNRMCLGISVFAAPIASGCLYLHAGNILQCVADLRIMPFLYRVRINNLHIPAGAIIRLFRNHISEPVFLPVCRNFNPIQRINSIYIHTACRKCQHCHHRIKLFTHAFSPLI